MVNHAAARDAVRSHLAAMEPAFDGDSWTILHDATIEHDWGWVFFYDSLLNQETGETRYTIAGNLPFIVRRSDGAVIMASSYRFETFIKDCLADGRLP